MGTPAMALNVLLVLALVLAFSNAGRVLGPRPVHEGDADEPYETGMLPFAPAADRMSVLYWRFAVLFVVFDVDLAFLLPWATSRGSVAAAETAAMTLFVALLAFMLAYFWRKGVLECD